MADIQERLAAARKKAESLKSEIAKAQSEKKDCAIQDAAAKKQADLKSLGPALKHRRVLKGHFGKVYAMHWSGDNVNLVSASQVRGRRCNRALILARKQKKFNCCVCKRRKRVHS
jgi:guanine nucleotide-binding protein G(I)/G(S)/G(T) subunit beta-1